jgi:hypothetical protein
MGHRTPTRRLSSLLRNPVVQNRLGFALNLTQATHDFQRPTFNRICAGSGPPSLKKKKWSVGLPTPTNGSGLRNSRSLEEIPIQLTGALSQ